MDTVFYQKSEAENIIMLIYCNKGFVCWLSSIIATLMSHNMVKDISGLGLFPINKISHLKIKSRSGICTLTILKFYKISAIMWDSIENSILS